MNERVDRAVGAILGLACGDALGAPYEYGPGQGEGDADFHAPRGWGHAGTWPDDTAMAVAILLGASEGFGFETRAGRDAVVRAFLRWGLEDGRVIGNLTLRVFLRAQKIAEERHLAEPGSAEFRDAATAIHRQKPDAAGNGALMRTAAGAIGCLDDRDLLAVRSRAIAELTHMHSLAGDSCVLWSEAIRIAIVDAQLDLDAGVDLLPADRRVRWRTCLDDAVAQPRRRSAPMAGLLRHSRQPRRWSLIRQRTRANSSADSTKLSASGMTATPSPRSPA